MFKNKIKRIFISLITNPILLIAYWLFFYELASVCRYGRFRGNLYILLGTTIFILAMIIFTVVKVIKSEEDKFLKVSRVKPWRYISIILIVVITLFYGFNIYKSSIKYNGKLSWVIDGIKNNKSVEFVHNDIYKYGVQGIFEDINKKFKLPKKLYMVNNFTLDFNSDGIITSFETFVYGKSDKGKEESYLISYNSNKSKKIDIRLNGYAAPTYNYDKLLEPLIDTVKTIPYDKVFDKFNSKKYGLVYYGKRDWGNNTKGIVNMLRGTTEENVNAIKSPMIGYTVSIFVPGKENEITPMRFNLVCDKEWSKDKTPPKDESDGNAETGISENNEKPQDTNEQFYLTKEIGYRLDVTGAALGSRSYSLSKTTDGGKSWSVINESPFGDTLGGASGISFINDKLGFIGLSKNGGGNGYLYRTDDGGKTFKEVSYPEHKIKDDGKEVSPFDTPSMPYEKDGVLKMLVGQGADGDYNGNSKALYESKDQGKTWVYVKEVKNSEIDN